MPFFPQPPVNGGPPPPATAEEARLQALAECQAAGGTYEECSGKGEAAAQEELSGPERDALDVWNRDRGEGVEYIGVGEAERARAYMKLYNVSFKDALWIFTAWQSGSADPAVVPSPSAASIVEGPDVPFDVPTLEQLTARGPIGGAAGAAGAAGRAAATSRFMESQIQRQTSADVTTTSQRLEFFDYPTPEEVLQNFETALATHLQAVGKEGGLPVDVIQGIMADPSLLLDDYLAEIGTRAARGENIFEFVGGGFEGAGEAPLGVRRGREEVSETLTEGMTITEQISRGTVGQVGGAAPGVTAVAEEEKITLTEEERTARALEEKEEVVARPRLAAVRSPSPLEFMQERFGTSSELIARYRGRKGIVQAERGRPAGVVITPRRVR